MPSKAAFAMPSFLPQALSQCSLRKLCACPPLSAELSRRSVEARCGLQVIDVRSGDVAHWLRIEGMVRKLYDVVVLPGVRRPMALGFKSDEIQRLIAVDDEGRL